jgi:prepilin-type N-terminal cleavage/methylation domain-containing protein
MIKSSKSGFTLVELIAAITIALILGTAVYGTLSGGINSKKKGNSIAEKNQIVRGIFDQIRTDLYSISMSSTTPSWTFTASTLNEGSTYYDSVQFVTTNQSVDWAAPPSSDEAVITYAINTVPNTNTIGLMRTVNRHITDLVSTDLNYQMISQDVLSLHFQYYDGTQWVGEWTDTSIIPKAIMITMGIRNYENPTTLNWYTTSVRLPKA